MDKLVTLQRFQNMENDRQVSETHYNLNNSYQIKTEELEDVKFNIEDLHHSIDIKEENDTEQLSHKNDSKNKLEKTAKVILERLEVNSTKISITKTRDWINTNKFNYNPVEIDNDNKIYKEICNRPDGIQNQNSDLESINETIDDDIRDKDFTIDDHLVPSSTSSNTLENDDELISTQIDTTLSMPLSETIKRNQITSKKVVQCRFCEEDIPTKNFNRHLQRKHKEESEVESIMNFPKSSKERRHALSLLRNDTNFDLFIKGIIRPSRQRNKEVDKNTLYMPCAYCKGLFVKNYLKRHSKLCINQNRTRNPAERQNHLSTSQTVMACAADPTNVISKLNVKTQVFDNMKADEISLEAKRDLLIAHFGESYMKHHKRERMAYACSNRMRELSRLLISYRKLINNEDVSLKDLLHAKRFDMVILAVRKISGYNHVTETFKAPSLAMQLGTSLKLVCNELKHLILKESRGYVCKSANEAKLWLEDINNFKELVETRWNTEVASLANKDMMEKRWNKPLLLPLASDIKKFKDGILTYAQECQDELENDSKLKEKHYTLLVQCILSLLIVFNRRRIGDVQYLKIKDYNNDNRTNYKEFENTLTETEKILTTKYKRVINSEKGSRVVVILIPILIQNLIDILLKHRPKYINTQDNDYVFSTPRSKIKWGKGDVALRVLGKKLKLENPEAFMSNKLRKQIATVMQLLNLSKDEAKQFATFMGRTEKTHNEFHELPVDIYQTAKVSKLLLMMENGSVPVEYKGKSLAEINLDPNLEYAEEDNNKDEGVICLDIADQDVASGSGGIININEKDKRDRKRTHEETGKSEDSDSDEKTNKKNNKKAIKKRSWSNIEVEGLTKAFSSYICKGVYPPGNKIKEYISKTKSKRTVVVIKSKLQHLIKNK